MDCLQTLEQLDMQWPDWSGNDTPGLPKSGEAAAHLESCVLCQTELEERHVFDQRIAAVMRDVAVPVGLKQRLLQACEQQAETRATETNNEQITEVAKPQKTTDWRKIRRRTFAAISVSAVVFLATYFLFPTPENRVPLSLADLQKSTNLQLTELETFDKNFQPELPQGLWQRPNRIQFAPYPRGDLKNHEGQHRVASFAFQFQDKQGQLFHGVLLVVPKKFLEETTLPPEFSVADAEGHYVHRSYGRFRTVAWTEGEHVFVCFMPVRTDGADGLKALGNILYPLPV